MGKNLPQEKSSGHDFERLAPYYDLALKVLFLPFGGEARLRRKIAFFLLSENLKQGGKILEIGCGTGSNLATIERLSFGKFELIGIDSSPSMINRARSKISSYKINFIVGEAKKLPFENEWAEAVLGIFMFHELLIDDRRMIIREVKRVLKKDGYFLLVDFSYPKNLLGEILFFFLKIIERKEALDFAKSDWDKWVESFSFRKKREESAFLGLLKIVLFTKQ